MNGVSAHAGRQAGAVLVGTVGGVLLDPADGTYLYFSGTLSLAAMRQMSSKAANPIAAVEALAVLLAVLFWSERMRSRTVLAFVDNEPAKAALVKGSSAAGDLATICGDVCAAEIKHHMLCFWERVPSASNVADPPSRGLAPPALGGLSPPSRSFASELTFRTFRAYRCSHLLKGVRDSAIDDSPASP